jgi:hypothetical protein
LRLIFAIITLLSAAHYAVAQEREWTLNASDKEAFLVFGVPDTDDVGLSLWCEIGTNKFSVFVNNIGGHLKQNQSTIISIDVDGKKYSIKAKAAVDKLGRSQSIEGQISSNDAFLKSAENGTLLKTTIQGHTTTYPLTDADITGLIRTCAGAVIN